MIDVGNRSTLGLCTCAQEKWIICVFSFQSLIVMYDFIISDCEQGVIGICRPCSKRFREIHRQTKNSELFSLFQ